MENHFIDDIRLQYYKLKNQAENAISQLKEEDFFRSIGSAENSIAILVKHITGNLKSRWTDFLTTDGEKPWRDRPDEFYQDERTKSEYMTHWVESWEILFETINNLSGSDLLSKVTIRQEEHTVVEALHRQLTHYAAHIGQIVLLAKHWKKDDWQTLSIPKNEKLYTGGTYKSQ